MAKTVVLGGGIGGLSCARSLRKHLSAEHTVTLVDAREEHVYQPSLLWVAFGSRSPDRIIRPLSRLERRGIRFHQAKVTKVDAAGRRVETDSGSLDFDYLIIALGAQLAPDRIVGLSEAAHIFYTAEGATQSYQAIQAFRGGRAVVAVSSMPYKCPAAPYEAAFLLDADLRRRGLRDSSTIEVVTFEPLPMPTAGPRVGKAIVDMLTRRGIEFRPDSPLKAVDPGEKQILAGDGQAIDFDLLLAVPPHKSPDPVAGSDIAGEGGWIPADPVSLKTSVDGVYAIGDVTAIKLKNGRMLPKAGVFAHAQAEVVAQEIADNISSKQGLRAFDGKGSCFLELGGGSAGFAVGDFYAEPDPNVQLKSPGRWRHWEKVLLEKWWLWGI